MTISLMLINRFMRAMMIVDYAFMGTDPNSPDNRWLRDAMQQQIAVIYFLGTSPGRYQPIIPTFIVGWDS